MDRHWWILLVMEIIGFIVIAKIKKDTQFLRLSEWKKHQYFIMLAGAFLALLPILGCSSAPPAAGGFIVILGVFSLGMLVAALATAKKRKVTYSANLYDKDTFDRLFGEISDEDIRYYRDLLTGLFRRIRNRCMERAEAFREQGPGFSGRSVLRGIRMFFRILFHRTAVTTATGVDPMYLDTDVTGIATAFRTENGFMHSCAKELAAGVGRYLDLLGSPDPENLKFAVLAGAAYYLEIKKYRYNLWKDDVPCYSLQIAYFLAQYAKTFNHRFYNKMCRYIGPEFHLSVNINMAGELYALYDSKTAGK